MLILPVIKVSDGTHWSPSNHFDFSVQRVIVQTKIEKGSRHEVPATEKRRVLPLLFCGSYMMVVKKPCERRALHISCNSIFLIHVVQVNVVHGTCFSSFCVMGLWKVEIMSMSVKSGQWIK